MNIAGGRTSSLRERLMSFSLGNTELEMLPGYQGRGADSSWKAGSRRCGFESHRHVRGLSYRKT